MKRFILFFILLFSLTACSFLKTEKIVLTEAQNEYIKSIIVCDSKTTDYEIDDIVQLAAFFNNGRVGTGLHEFEYHYQKNGIEYSGKITLSKVYIDEQEYYLADFDRMTFPFSECRNLKSNSKRFE